MKREQLIAVVTGLLALAVLVTAGLWFSGWARQRSGVIRLQLQVDGSDTIKLQGSRLWIEHHTHRRPGQIGTFNDPGALPDNNAVYINGEAWKPRWRGNESEPFHGEHPAIPRQRRRFDIRQSSGPGSATITETPTSGNLYTVSVRIDDDSHPGTGFYDLRLEW